MDYKKTMKDMGRLGKMMIWLLLAIIWFPSNSLAQNAPKDYVDAHNAARAEVKVKPMTWDNALATYALNYMKSRSGNCPIGHSAKGAYGENSATGTGELTGKQAVELWVREKPWYDYRANSCKVGKPCLHYTQVVWRDSVRLGCARIKCTNNPAMSNVFCV